MLSQRRSGVTTILFCHFISAFAALGLPPFFGLILRDRFYDSSAELAGVLYVLPTLFAALAAPFWGALSDRFGKKRLLIRAQLGLALSFALAGFAPNAKVFVAALVLQGLLGGTFAASRAYLGTLLSGSRLAEGLTLMEASPRLALVTAPVFFGFFFSRFTGAQASLELYRYLALLPMAAALLISRLPPAESSHSQSELKLEQISASLSRSASGELWAAMIAQFVLGLSSVLISPYFVSAVQDRFQGISASQAGLLFGLPHLFYLLSATTLSSFLADRAERLLVPALIILAASQWIQGFCESVWTFGALRIAAGFSMTLAFLALHALLSQSIRSGREGRLFGIFEFLTKFSAVLGGFAATGINSLWGHQALFSFSALSLGLAAIAIVLIIDGQGYEVSES